ncbi:MAG: multicopper oxidase domain-containing protein [Longimicrobiaceae bacterium]
MPGDFEAGEETGDLGGGKVRLSRREMLKSGALGAAGLAAAGSALGFRQQQPHELPPGASRVAPPRPGGIAHEGHASHENMMAVGEFQPGGFDPSAFLTHFDTGNVSRLPSGQILREYQIVAIDKEIEVAPGVFFPAWTYNGQVPGPTIRCTEGDRIRVRFINGGSHPHTIHFHGIHAANMDGSFEIVQPGGTFTYEFDAEPFGLHLYHCHAVPLKRHIHKGLYGVFLIDPKEGRPPARELVMMMNAFDTNFDGENEIYAVNTAAFHYQKHPIPIRVGELVRIYLVNITEFDLINSFHLHGNFFRLYRTGTRLDHYEFTDTMMLTQGERAVLELTYKLPGRFLFHAHQSEFAELGWVGIFDVQEAPDV